MWVTGNLKVNANGETITIGVKKNAGKIVSPITVRATTSGQSYAFSTVAYFTDVEQNDYFELYVADNTTSGKEVTVEDLTIYMSAR